MRQIRRVAVLGSGVMGATIAAQLANAGLEVLLLDMVPRQLSEAEQQQGLTLESPAVRNRIVADGLKALARMKPAPFYRPDYARRIATGNFEDDIARIGECDWVLEVVVENLKIKRQLLADKVVPNLAPGTILSSNTSGLSVNAMAEVLPPEVRKNFLVTHFFNPPRYMRLLEVVGCDEADSRLVEEMAGFLTQRLGKGIVFARDTPNFVANRVGVYAIFKAIEHMVKLDLTVEEVDAVSGPATGRPRSAVFRTADLVGIDTLVHVADNSYRLLPGDEERETFKVPDFITAMVEKDLLGDKTRKGFYRKEKSAEGRRIYYYDYRDGDYRPLQKPKFASLEGINQMDDPGQRVKAVVSGKDKAGEFAWRSLRDTLIYTANRIPEIAADVVNVDNAMRWGFNWELGPFEMLDAIGVAAFVARAEQDGVEVPDTLKGVESFYAIAEGKKLYFDLQTREYRPVPFPADQIVLDVIRSAGSVVEQNPDCSLHDLGEGVFGLEFHSKMNTIGPPILTMVQRAVRRAEEEGVGLVVANQGSNFSVGANLMVLAGALMKQDFAAIGDAVHLFQQATMALKYARVPVVAAPFNMTLGGACEFCLHSAAVNAHAETYMGLVEIGVGLLPAGGGTKELALRAMDLAERYQTDVSPFIFKFFQNIGMAKVSTSADDAFALGLLRAGDTVTLNLDRLIADARQRVLALARTYRPPVPAQEFPAPGRSIAASMKSQLWNLAQGGQITEYERYLAGVIAEVITGGDVPAGTPISEAYLLELEREGFLRLCGNRQTAERIEHMLKKGKPLRN